MYHDTIREIEKATHERRGKLIEALKLEMAYSDVTQQCGNCHFHAQVACTHTDRMFYEHCTLNQPTIGISFEVSLTAKCNRWKLKEKKPDVPINKVG